MVLEGFNKLFLKSFPRGSHLGPYWDRRDVLHNARGPQKVRMPEPSHGVQHLGRHEVLSLLGPKWVVWEAISYWILLILINFLKPSRTLDFHGFNKCQMAFFGYFLGGGGLGGGKFYSIVILFSSRILGFWSFHSQTLKLGMETPKTWFSSLFKKSGSIFVCSKESGSGGVDFGG